MCPAIQRLPVRLHGRPGGTAEFLRLPFGLRERAASLTSRDEAVKLALKRRDAPGGAEEGRQQGERPFVSPPSPLGPREAEEGVQLSVSLCASALVVAHFAG